MESQKLKIYLDNCCYNRPYDNQEFIAIRHEAEAKIYIQKLVINNEIDLVSSYILVYENNRNNLESKKNAIEKFFVDYSSVYVSNNKKDEVEKIALLYEKAGIKHLDALHMACATIADCDYFITTDKRILKYNGDDLKVINPKDFISLVGGQDD